MKTTGIIGGMSWESTATYYEIINQEVIRRLDGFHSAKILMQSADFDELEGNMENGYWQGIADFSDSIYIGVAIFMCEPLFRNNYGRRMNG